MLRAWVHAGQEKARIKTDLKAALSKAAKHAVPKPTSEAQSDVVDLQLKLVDLNNRSVPLGLI